MTRLRTILDEGPLNAFFLHQRLRRSSDLPLVSVSAEVRQSVTEHASEEQQAMMQAMIGPLALGSSSGACVAQDGSGCAVQQFVPFQGRDMSRCRSAKRRPRRPRRPRLVQRAAHPSGSPAASTLRVISSRCYHPLCRFFFGQQPCFLKTPRRFEDSDAEIVP